jgi:predicted RNase H-like HicB family nuclease
MKMKSQPRYTVIIQWSEEDDAYLVSLPEWGPGAKTHGDTYEQAAHNAQEVLELLAEDGSQGAKAQMPEPRLFRHPGAGVVDLPADQTEPARPRTPTKKSA